MNKNVFLLFTLFLLFSNCIQTLNAQMVNVGSGSYTTNFPGVDAAARNSYPSGTPQLSGKALGKPVPTNDWWSQLIKSDQARNLFTYPFTLKTISLGLVVSYIPSGVIDDLLPVTVGVEAMTASRTTISDYSDWTATMNWNDGTHFFETTAGIAMPFLYFIKGSADIAKVTVTSGTVTISNEMLIITNAKNGADFAVYAPTGSTWIQNGSSYTSTLNGKNYWSLAFIPLTASNVTTVATEYKKYAYVFPKRTTATFSYLETNSVVRTDFNVETEIKEGTESNMLIGLLPHQWAHLASNSPIPTNYSYATIRGEMKTLSGNNFSVENTFHGILPTLPYVDNYSEGFDPTFLSEKIATIQNDALDSWTDSYNEGQMMNRLVQTARIAAETGDSIALRTIVSTVKERLEDWLKTDNGEVAFLFYYNQTWSAMLGYPAGHGQDSNLNDHHFHWGYFIGAAAFLEQYEPGWAAKYGEMINLLVRDAATTDRYDPMFPYLRNFNPFDGHCWSNGFATFPQGNDQESTSESMQFNSSLIHWGTVTGNKSVRDLGIYLYTTEQTAIEEYWLDTKERNFPSNQQYALVSRVWGNSIDNGTFWTGDIAASYGIEMYPIHGGSLYLGQDTAYVARLWNEIKANTGILNNEVNDNLWHDVMWEYLAFIDPRKAIELYDSNPNRSLKFGISDAQTYHWLHAMDALGRVDATVTADYPIAAAFKQNGQTTYVAQNYGSQTRIVTFSTGYKLEVPARSMATSKDSPVKASLTTSFSQAYEGGSVQLSVQVVEGSPTSVEFMDGTKSIGTLSSEPYIYDATPLTLGLHHFYAKVHVGNSIEVTNGVAVQVGKQIPFTGIVWSIPGTIEAGKYDAFEGGVGQNISYLDLTRNNSGDFRMNEYVDASTNVTEGAAIGWISSGEWLEYTVSVSQSGLYDFSFRYASGNVNGGGPFHLELDGQTISGDVKVPSTSTSVWDVWASKTIDNIALTEGEHVLRLVFSYGEFNLGRFTFTRKGDMPYSFPLAKAGADVKVLLPKTTHQLNGSGSTESGGKSLTYKWKQLFGPSILQFSDNATAQPTVEGLKKGVYGVKLTVMNPENRTDEDELIMVVTDSENISPMVSMTSPVNNASIPEGKAITLTANASDFDGSISRVEFYSGEKWIATDETAPYSASLIEAPGTYSLTARATDNGGVVTTSQPITITIVQVNSCTHTSSEASQGSFTTGYSCKFETIGTTVNITFELLDNKNADPAYLWTQSPFSEKMMLKVGSNKFSTTLTGQAPGTTITVACKFAYTGGMSVTKYWSYVVGNDCDGHTGSSEIQVESALKLYPNPAKDILHIQTNAETSKLVVTDVAGRIVLKETVPAFYSLNVSGLESGVYFIQLESTYGFQKGKFLKQ